MKKLALSIFGLVFGAVTMTAVIEASREAQAGPSLVVSQASAGSAVMVEPFDAGAGSAGSALAPAAAGSGSATVITPAPVAESKLPNPVESPVESAGFVYKLYKAGHLVPALIVLSFFLLLLLQKWIAWLRTGYRKLVVASTLVGLGMLAERAAEGTTPNLMMLMGAFGVALALYTKGGGEPTEAEA